MDSLIGQRKEAEMMQSEILKMKKEKDYLDSLIK